MEMIFGALGLLGGVLCSIGDVLLDYKGRGNEKRGKYHYIESHWDVMKPWRFKLSIPLAAVGVPLYFLGLTSLAMQMTHETFALVFWLICLVGGMGGFCIHAMLCIFPLLYQGITAGQTFEETEDILNRVFHAMKIPFVIQFVLLVIVSSLLVSCAIIWGFLSLPSWMILLTPLCLMMIGILLRLIKKAWFSDLPGIVMPSLGLGMMGLMAMINAAEIT